MAADINWDKLSNFEPHFCHWAKTFTHPGLKPKAESVLWPRHTRAKPEQERMKENKGTTRQHDTLVLKKTWQPRKSPDWIILIGQFKGCRVRIILVALHGDGGSSVYKLLKHLTRWHQECERRWGCGVRGLWTWWICSAACSGYQQSLSLSQSDAHIYGLVCSPSWTSPITLCSGHTGDPLSVRVRVWIGSKSG